MLHDREKTVLEVLEKIPKQNVVLVGGYAVNAYVPPRFSIDCDLVVLGKTRPIEAVLKDNGFEQAESGDIPYGRYIRYLRKKEKVSFDLLINSVQDRNSEISFGADLFKKYSKNRLTVGRATPIRISLKIADPELLFAMKFVTGRKQDIRDIFMLSGESIDWEVVGEIILEKCSKKIIKERIEPIRDSIRSKDYRDSLHGSFGKMPDQRFALCQKNLLGILDKLYALA
jgi:hypothetical protein